jgi:isopentenyl-diphosphate delta-isomerase
VIEEIVLVDDSGKKIGVAPKLESHHAKTPLHLAFSCYVFNKAGDFLVTQRAHVKKVWPGVWTNSVCGHLMPGESTEQAIRRRLAFELGIKKTDSLKVVLQDYRYTTPPFNGIIENEICPVYIATVSEEPNPNPDEVENYKWVKWPDMLADIKAVPKKYSYWFKDQLKQLPDLS